MANANSVSGTVGSAIVSTNTNPYVTSELWQDRDLEPGFATSAALDLDVPQKAIRTLLLKANEPSIVTLTGSSDLAFSALTIALTARALTRNMALGYWGTQVAPVVTRDDGVKLTTYALPGPTRLQAACLGSRLRNAKPVQSSSKTPLATTLAARENGAFNGVSVQLTASGALASDILASKSFDVTTDAVQAKDLPGSVYLLLLSDSAPSRVAISLGDDSPAQVFPAVIAADSTAISRDLSGHLNAVWRSAAASGAKVSVALKLTSATDGLVDVDLRGVWGHSWKKPQPASVELNALGPAALREAWPFGAMSADVYVTLEGKLSGGLRTRWTNGAGGEAFAVRVAEKLEVAQAIQLLPEGDTAAARRLAAAWIALPGVPAAEQKLELRLAEVAGSPAAPGAEPLARAEAKLPADAAAYIAAGGDYWFRVPFDKPVPIDGAAATKPLFLIAAGRGGGTPLVHRYLSAAPDADAGSASGGAAADRLPGAMATGTALYRNLTLSGAWEQQGFNRRKAVWRAELELVPEPGDYARMLAVQLGVPGGASTPSNSASASAPAYVGLTGPSLSPGVQMGWSGAQPSADGFLTIAFDSPCQGRLKATLSAYRPVSAN